MTGLAIVRTNGREVVFVDGLNFIKEIIDGMVAGDLRICPYSGQPKNSNQWIASDSFSRAEKEKRGKGLEIVRAVQKAFVLAGGVVVEQPQRPSRIDNDFFYEIVDVGKVWLFKNQNATVKNLHEYLVFLYNKVDKGVLGKAAGMAFKFYKAEIKATEVVLKWYEQKPNDFRKPREVGLDIMFKFKPEVGEKKIIKAVWLYQDKDEFYDRKKSWRFQRCEGAVNNYIGKTLDGRHPGEIAQEIIDNYKAKGSDSFPQSILPMLTRAVANHLNKLREAEHKRLTASHGGGQKVKKPGSVARRHNGHISKVRMAGAKKRGVKG